MANATPIQATNPIFNSPDGIAAHSFLNELQTGGMTLAQAQQFISSVVSYIDDSSLLISQINDLSSKMWHIQDLAQGGDTDVPKKQIQINVTNSMAIGGYNITSGSAVLANFTNVTDFVGALAHEVGHAEDTQLNTISLTGNALAVGAMATLGLLSEGKAQLNDITAAQQIYAASKQTVVVTVRGFPGGINQQILDAPTNPAQAVIDGADSYLHLMVSIPTDPSIKNYLTYYWKSYLNNLLSTFTSTTPAIVTSDLQSLDMNNANNLTIVQNTNGTDTMTVTLGSGAISTYVDDFGNYGPITPSDLDGGQNSLQAKSPSPTNVATYQEFTFLNGTYYLDIYNPALYTTAISNFTLGDTIDLAGVGTATGATIGAGGVLSVAGVSGGTINLNLDPTVNYTGQTAVVTSDGAGGTDLTLGPAVSHTITFSEYPVGTTNPIYKYPDNTVDVIGQIVNDGAQPASPSVAANPSYVGPVFINFATPVTNVSFDAGYFDNLQSTTITFIGPGGTVLQTSLNSQYGIVPYTYANPGGISAINVVNTGYDASGFSVDTVTFSGAVTPPAANTTINITPGNAVLSPGDPVFSFNVTRTGDTSGASSVGYAVNGTGSNPLVATDLPNGIFPVGQVSFAAGQVSQTVTVDVLGGFTPQDPVTFAVTLIAPSTGTVVGVEDEAAATTLPPPTISNTVAGQETTDALTIDPFTKVTISDPNAGETETLTVSLSAAANGMLSDLSDGSYNVATGAYTDTGSAAAVTTALDGLVFIPTQGQTAPGQTVTTGFTINVVDDDNAFTSDTSTTVIATATAVPPTINGTAANQTTTDQTAIAPFSTVTIADANAGQTETVTITLSAAADGALSNLGSGSYNAAKGVYTDTGSAAAVTSALDSLVFTPTPHQVPAGQTVTTTFTINDTDTAGASASDGITSVAATATASLLTIAGTVAGQKTTDLATAAPFSKVTISDQPPGQTEAVTVTLSAAANGTIGNLSGGSYNSTTGVYSDSGTAAAVTSALDGLVFTPTAHQVAAGQTVTTTFAIEDSDTAGATASDSTTTVIVTATGGLPSITGTVAGQRTTDTATIMPFSKVTIADPSAGQVETVMVALSAAANGTLSNLGGGRYNSSSGVYTDTGSAAAVTAALDGLVFNPTAHQVGPGQSVTTGFTITDIDTAMASTTDSTTTVIATAIAASPTITGAVAGQTTADTVAISPFSNVTITDPNPAQTETVTVTLSAAANGTLSALGGGSYNAATGVYTDTGSAAAVTAALDGLVFNPTAHQVGPGQSVTTGFTITDIDTAMASTTDSTTTVIATAIATSPTITGAVAGQTTADTVAISPFSNMTIADPNSAQTETVTITLSSAANGTLSALGGGSYNATTGVYTDTGSAAAVTSALDGLLFTPTAGQIAAGQSVTTGFTIRDSDTAGASTTNSTTTVIATNKSSVPGTGFDGDIVTLSVYYPNVISADLLLTGTETVVPGITTFPNILALASVNSPPPTVSLLGPSVDFNGSNIVIAYPSTEEGETTATGTFNGFVFQTAANDAAITGASIASSNIPGLTAADLSFTAHSITLNEAGLTLPGNALPSITIAASFGVIFPTISGTMADQSTSDTDSLAPFSKVTIADANSGQTETVTIALSGAANGTLSNLGGGSYNATTGIYTDIGSAAAVTSALDGLVFTPALQQVALGQTVSTGFTIYVTDTAGASASDKTTSVVVTAPQSTSTAAEVAAAYQAILRISPPNGTTGSLFTSVAAEIDAGVLTLGAYEASLVGLDQTLYTTIAALVTVNAFYKATPTSANLTTIATATSGTSYFSAAELHNLGYSDPNVWTVLASGWGADPTSNFFSLYDSDATGTAVGYTAFINSVYAREFGAAPSAANLQNLLADVPGTQALLNGGGHVATPIQVMAGLYGYLLEVGQTYGIGQYATATTAFLTAAANGTAIYGPELTTEFPAAKGAAATDAAVPSSAMTDPNVITVTNSNQLIDPGPGGHTIQFLTGSRSDAVVLHANGADQISGFDPTTDVLDLSSLLTGTGLHLTDNLSVPRNDLTVVDQGTNALLRFDPTGHGGGATVAVLQGLGSGVTSLNTLVAQGAIRFHLTAA
jgi:hypothetical protein